jgi:hypothetical protein
MNPRMISVLLVMTLAVLAACFPAVPDESVLVAFAQDGSSGAAAPRTDWR